METINVSTHAGRLKFFTKNWKQITDDKVVLSWLEGYKLPFVSTPVQYGLPQQPKQTAEDDFHMQNSIDNLIKLGAVEPCDHCAGEFLSSIFLVPKSNGSKRFILNLKKLNQFLSVTHFKLEDIRTVSRLLAPNFYMSCIDLKDAYFLLPIHKNHRKYLRFVWKNQLFEFTCLPFGLSVAPFVFTKLMKPVVKYLREKGFLSVIYLDDILCMSNTKEGCQINLQTTKDFLEWLGFVINFEKSNFVPSKICQYLGFMFDSSNMTISLPLSKRQSLIEKISVFRRKQKCTIRAFANLIGTITSVCPAVKYGWLYTKNFEREKYLALLHSQGNYDAFMRIPKNLLSDFDWWLKSLPNCFNPLIKDKYKVTMYTDSSLKGWGIVRGSQKTHGFWSESQSNMHINYLELLAIFYGLKSLARDEKKCSILLRVDNTTAISYINRMGSIQFPYLNSLAREIWKWCEAREIWLFASHIKSADNFEADEQSRCQKTEIEWELNNNYFKRICQSYGNPEIDLFANINNHKCNRYVSWFPDPGAVCVDAFTISWKNLKFYAFPPFSLISKVLQKIRIDNAEGVVVVPHWPAQPWFPCFLSMCKCKPLTFDANVNLLIHDSRIQHPLASSLSLMAGKLWSRDS
jgi:ribonuclease HI